MSRYQSIRSAFQRQRRPGDLVFAVVFLLFAIFLLSQLGSETQWVKRTKLFAQPAFWPAVSLVGMAVFALLHYLGSVLSPRISGRLEEVLFWARSLEFALWFIAYVWVVPYLGYLLSTMIFTSLLTWRVGYRDRRMILAAVVMGLVIVVIFKAFLSVKIPGGIVYEYLPDGLRNFMLINF